MSQFKLQLAVLWAMCLICVNGCGKKYEPVPQPVTRMNHSPKNKYTINVYTKDGIPRNARVRIWYEISNRQCIPLDHSRAIGGVRLNYPVRVDSVPVQISGSRLQTEVADDGVLPGDYWGLGTCHWTLQNVAIYFGNIHHAVRMSGDKVRNESTVTWGCRTSSGSIGGFSCFELSRKVMGEEYDSSSVRTVSSFQGSIFFLNAKRIGK